MARNLLTARQVQTAKDGDHADGDGLRLQVRGSNASWIFRFTSPAGKRREQGLGTATRNNIGEAGKSLTEALELAERSRALLRDKVDPIDHDREQREKAKRDAEAAKLATQAERFTLRRAARQYHEEHVEPVPTFKQGRQWIASIEGPPADDRTPEQRAHRRLLDALLDRSIDAIEPLELLDALVPLCRAVPETGFRVYQRLALIFDAAILAGRAARRTPRRRSARNCRAVSVAAAVQETVTTSDVLPPRFD